MLVGDELLAPAFVNQHVALVRPDPAAVFPRYLAYALHSHVGRVQFKVGEYGGTKQGLGLNDVKSAVVALPPLSEQRVICRELDRNVRRLAMAIESAEREMRLLREYRTCLNADVVTGKVDVRVAAAHLADEPTTLGDEELLAEDAQESDAGGDGAFRTPEAWRSCLIAHADGVVPRGAWERRQPAGNSWFVPIVRSARIAALPETAS